MTDDRKQVRAETSAGHVYVLPSLCKGKPLIALSFATIYLMHPQPVAAYIQLDRAAHLYVAP